MEPDENLKKAKKLKLDITDMAKNSKKLPNFLGKTLETPIERKLQETLEKHNIELVKSLKKEELE